MGPETKDPLRHRVTESAFDLADLAAFAVECVFDLATLLLAWGE
jgi:hypothetical protein